MIHTKQDLIFYLKEDFRRNGFIYNSRGKLKRLLYALAGSDAASALGYLMMLRKCEYFFNQKNSIYKIFYIVYKIRLGRLGRRYNIRIPLNRVGYGLRIHHIAGGGGCLLSCKSMGNYCGVNTGVLLGNNKTSDDKPTIGDNVMLNTGVKCFGDIHIGDNVIIGANAVVSKNIPSNSVAVGVPAKVIKTI